MQRSNILSEKLNSDVELEKRVRFAETVFKSNLSIAYKEEYILIWFLKKILEVSHEGQKLLTEGFCSCIESEKMAVMPGSGVRTDAKTNITKYLGKILKKTQNHQSNLIDAIFKLLKKFFLHYKSHPKQYVNVVCILLSQNVGNSQYAGVLNLTSDIFKGGTIHEKFLVQLLKREFDVFFNKLNDQKDLALIKFIQKMFFKKEIVNQLQITLHAICFGHKTTTSSSIIQLLIKFLHGVYLSELDITVKVQVFCKVFQAFIKSNTDENNLTVLQFFVLMCHILGLEQNVSFQQSSESNSNAIISEDCIQEVFNVSSITPSDASYVIVKSLINVLNSISPDLNQCLLQSTYLHWFQSFLTATVNAEEMLNVHLDLFCSCADLNTSIFEKNFTKIFSRILVQPLEKFENNAFKESLHKFMENAFQMYIKLQRVQKFVLKLLQCIRNTKTALTQKTIFSVGFIHEFSNAITLLPSSQSVTFMDELLNILNNDCVSPLEENSESVNILLIQSICFLMSAFLCGVRVLNHMTPEGIIKSFLSKMQELKDILGRFGKALLIRIHDREIVQPFLNLSFYWSEIELLIMYYVEDSGEQLMNKDISPTDLSTLHSYLSGGEWNILAERVSNFGVPQCYQLFLKLILQKLRILQLKKCHSLINGEATSKYILTQLTSELYKHNIIEELTPEDINFLLNYLPQGQSRLLLEKLYNHPLEGEKNGKLIDWMRNSILLDNRHFIILSLDIILKKICSKLNSVSKHTEIPVTALTLNLVDENYNIIRDEFLKFVDELNQMLRGNTSIPKNNSKMMELKIFVDVFMCLPLLDMSSEIHSLALTALTYLAVAFSNFEEFLKPLLILIYNLYLSIWKRRSLNFECFDLGLCIQWLLHLNNVSDHVKSLKMSMVKLLLRSGTNTENGSRELKEMINSMKKKKKKKIESDSSALEYHILLHEDLIKCFAKTQKRSPINVDIAEYRGTLSKMIRKELEKQNSLETPTADSEVLVTAYSIELTRVVKSKNEDNIVGLVNLNFEKFFNIAVSEVKNGSKKEGYRTFLTTVLHHMPYIKKHIKEINLTEIWNAFKTHATFDWKLIYTTADDTEFEFFLSDLLKMWTVVANGTKDIDLGTYFDIWTEFYCKDKVRRIKLYEKYLKLLFVQFSAGAGSLERFTSDQIVHLFNFFKFCISTSSLAMTSTMIDTSCDIMYNYNYGDDLSNKEFQNVFVSCVSGASWLLTTRWERVKDKIHNVFEIFSKLLDALAKRSSVTSNVNEDDLLALSTCSHNLEKWTSKMISLDKDFSRVAVYFIAAIVSSFVQINIYPVVKAPLINCVHNFLSISDSHNVAHLLRVLKPGNQQVFNGIYEMYKKYYKFTGRV